MILRKVRFLPVVLMEVLISLALAGMLLALVLGFFSQVTRLGLETVRVREYATARRYAQARLSQVMHRSLFPEAHKERVIFYTKPSDSALVEGQSLIFSYDNGAVIDPTFSNAVLGRLFIDSSQRLCLATWPLPAKDWQAEVPPMRKEILLEAVSNLEFRFFYPQIAGEQNPFDREEFDSWDRENQVQPVLVTISFQHRKKRQQLVFALPNAERIPKLGGAA